MTKKKYPELVEMFAQFAQNSDFDLDKDAIFETLKKKGFLDEQGNPVLVNGAALNLIKTMQKFQQKK